MRSIHLLLFALALGTANAQNITEYRYWFDDDVANTVTQTVAAIPTLDLTASLPTSGLEPGFHRITLQFSDGADWSSPLTQVFSRSGSDITGYRYWLNNDPSTVTNVSITPEADVQLNDILNNVSTDRDFNMVTIQFVDADGTYSAPITSVLVRGIGPVTAYEYCIDDQIADRSSGNIGPATLVDLITDLATGTTTGSHLFTIRFQGGGDGWSVPLTTEFDYYTSISELLGITNVTIFPNPTVEHIGVRMTSEGRRTLEVSVIDTKGSEVHQFPTWTVAGTAHQSWSIAALRAGNYFLRLREGESSWTSPFVKQ